MRLSNHRSFGTRTKVIMQNTTGHDQEFVAVKAYGVFRHSGFFSFQVSRQELIEGRRIKIENHEYLIVSVILDSPNHYSINVNLQQ